MTADELFDDQTSAGSLPLEERSRFERDQAAIRDVQFPGADGSAVQAYVVRPAGGAPKAAVLFLHWLGDALSSREEFFDEAVDLAAQRVASMLITQHFPWAERPSGVEHDRIAIALQVRTIRRALTLLAANAGPVKLAIVGHDYGAMHGILAASVDPRVAAVACMAPDATWVNWFVKYFHVVGADDRAGYAQAMADLDPVTRVADIKAPILFQFGSNDQFVSNDVVQALTEAAPGGTDIQSYAVGHRLDARAETDRDSWLLEQLGVPTGA
jgi:pimeloyl-ACP methyl ester carboxylesterase